jgi:hypothetical protein
MTKKAVGNRESFNAKRIVAALSAEWACCTEIERAQMKNSGF